MRLRVLRWALRRVRQVRSRPGRCLRRRRDRHPRSGCHFMERGCRQYMRIQEELLLRAASNVLPVWSCRSPQLKRDGDHCMMWSSPHHHFERRRLRMSPLLILDRGARQTSLLHKCESWFSGRIATNVANCPALVAPSCLESHYFESGLMLPRLLFNPLGWGHSPRCADQRCHRSASQDVEN